MICILNTTFWYNRGRKKTDQLSIFTFRRFTVINGIHSSISALLGLQKKLESTANNVANSNSDGYKKTKVTLQEGDPNGVSVHIQKIEDQGPMVYEQTAGGEQLVEKSNVDLTEEIPDLMLTKRFYQANLKAIQTEDEMLGSLLDIKS